ncbi:MBL fold metallo-hydrolase [Amycolatopsis jejuensis]|uniref:MBL fold metallo-hydrolase n=1 Tax=Amycolatopsis jejuensis TaxID=330084 RepID=UPI000525B30A|nr:MBL fold metallo-hydrolase [Amycolatopsis jejuensis]
MIVTKYTHACVRIDDGDRSVVIDPGIWSELGEALDSVRGVLVTHEHPDHVDVAGIKAAGLRNPDLRVWAPESVAAALSDLGDRATVVTAGETFEAGGFTVETFGGQHAVVHPSIPVIDNVGYFVEGVYHPGDSFAVPNRPVRVLAVPLHAPWSTTGAVVDFTVAVRAPVAFQIHECLLSDFGRDFCEQHVAEASAPFGVDFRHVDPGTAVEVA